MSRIAFVQNIIFEHLGLMHLSSVLKKNGHRVEMFLEFNRERLIKEILNYKPDILGFSCTTGAHYWALEVAGQLKEKSNSLLTLFGGPHPTFFPQIIEEKVVDIVCIGEGEEAVLELANKIKSGQEISNIKNLWIKDKDKIIKNELRPLIDDLDSLPFADRNLYYEKYPFLMRRQKVFMAGRGCPFSCTFCFNRTLRNLYHGKGQYVRLRSVDNLINEIEMVRDKFCLKAVYFQDDVFILDKIWIEEFTFKYKIRINLPFICLIRADLANEEIIAKLHSAGCVRVAFGIESGDEKIRRELLCKDITDEEIFQIAQLLKKYKIKFRTYNMLGLPEEDLTKAVKTIRINARIRTDYPWCSIFQPYPKTVLGEYAIENGWVEKDSDAFNSFFFRKSIIRLEDRRQIENLQKLFFYVVKMPWLIPLITKLIKLPPNIIFDLLFLVSYSQAYRKFEMLNYWDLFRIAKGNIKNFFK